MCESLFHTEQIERVVAEYACLHLLVLAGIMLAGVYMTTQGKQKTETLHVDA